MKVTFVGDVALGSTLWSIRDPYREVDLEITKGDLLFFNWEFPFTTLWKPESVMSYRGYSVDTSLAEHFLRPLSKSIASIVNNHIRDWGLEGIKTTKNLLQQYDIAPIGIDGGDGNPQAPFTITKDSVTLGFLAYSQQSDFSAHKFYPGPAGIEFEQIKNDISSLKGNVAHVIVSLHWGTEFSEYPKLEELSLGRQIIDCGASLVHYRNPCPQGKVRVHWLCLLNDPLLHPRPELSQQHQERGNK